MAKRMLSREPGGLEIVSRGRKGPEGSLRLSPEQVEQIRRTVRRTPEVIVKVSGGARESGGAEAHFKYIDRHGKLSIETDDGKVLSGKGVARDLVSDWNLDLSAGQYRGKPSAEGERDRRPKLVHNIVLSMPVRTPPAAVLAAARKFAREEFALQHRYAMVLHTDQGHPHVHLVVKAEHEYEPGKRLHISKPMLRHWREEFAACLREQGVAANASTAWTRGRARTGKKDPIHHRLRAMRDFATPPESAKRGVSPPKASTFMRRKVTAVAAELRSGSLQVDPAKQALLEGRRVLEEDWASVAAALREQGEADLAHQVEGFVQALPEVRTEKESIAAGLLAEINAQRRSHSNPSGDRGGQEPGQLK